jgi:hypothetical protein
MWGITGQAACISTRFSKAYPYMLPLRLLCLAAADLDHLISGQFIVQLADDVADANAAGEVLVGEVQAAMIAAAPSVSNGVVTAASHQASSFKVLRTLGGSSSSSDEAVAPGAAAAAAGVGAAGAVAAPPPPKSLLISAPDSAVEFMKASSVVKAVVKDRVVASQQTAGCVERSWLQTGITATLLSGFTWPGCITTRSKLIWKKRGYRVCSSGYAATDTS